MGGERGKCGSSKEMYPFKLLVLVTLYQQIVEELDEVQSFE